MEKVRFIHTADVQLGATYKNLPPDVAELKKMSQREGFAFLVRYAIEQEVDLFLIAGDLFDNSKPATSDVQFIKQQLQLLQQASVATCIIPGNHDYYEKGNFWDRHEPWSGAKVFKNYEFESIVMKNLHLEIFGAAFDRNHSSENYLQKFSHTSSQARSLLLFHGSWQNFGREAKSDYPFDIEDVANIPCNYIALGHYHRMIEVINTKTKKALYCGDTEGLDFSKSEVEQKGAIFGVIEPNNEVHVTFFPIESMPMQRLEIDTTVTTLAGVDQALTSQAHPKKLLQLVLSGIPSVDLLAEIPQLEEQFSHLFAHFEVRDKTLGIVEADLMHEKTYRGIFYKTMKEKMDNARNDEEKKHIQNALSYGLAAFEGE